MTQTNQARYRLRHLTRYDYTNKVELASHVLHLTPRALPGQQVLAADLTITPTPTRMHADRDHFGNVVNFLFFDWPHRSLEVLATAEIAVAFPALPKGATLSWDDVRAQALQSWEAADFLFASPMVTLHDSVTAYARNFFPPGRPILAGLLALTQQINKEFTFSPGTTHLSTPITDVLEKRQGVCQDFTHLMISGLRGLGLPARYVSGYIRNDKTADQAVLTGADHSHAWVECWLGHEHGWVGLDPTNGISVYDDHVLLAWGRDYCDVSPVRGVILGGGAHRLDVEVDLQAVDNI